MFCCKIISSEKDIRNLNVFSKIFGYPTRIITNKGSEFMLKEFINLCSENNNENIWIKTDERRGNGHIGRISRNIIANRMKPLLSDSSEWHKVVRQVHKAINSTLNVPTKFTRF